MAIGCCKDALVFYFCPASTKKWKIFQTILSSFRQCLHFYWWWWENTRTHKISRWTSWRSSCLYI